MFGVRKWITRGMVAAGMAVVMAGCGLSQPLVIQSRASQTRIIKPTAVVSVMPAKSETVRADLTGTAAPDRLTVTRNSPGASGTLRVSTVSGSTLWTQSQVGGVLIWQFGRRHLPVVLVKGSNYDCGSGGCRYQAYSWDKQSDDFVQVLGPTITAYRYLPKTRQFEETQVPFVGGLFGFVQVHGSDLQLISRTYDLWQSAVITPLLLEVTGAGTATIAAGSDFSYLSSGAKRIPITTPFFAVEAFAQARALNLSQEGKPLIAPQDQVAVWKATAALSHLGTSLGFVTSNPHTISSAGNSSVTAVLTGFVLNTKTLTVRLVRYRLVATVQGGEGTGYRLTRVSIKPMVLKVSTSQSVLKRLAQNPRFLRAMTQHPRWDVELQPMGDIWQIALQGPPDNPRNYQSLLSLNAQTGAMARVTPR